MRVGARCVQVGHRSRRDGGGWTRALPSLPEDVQGSEEGAEERAAQAAGRAPHRRAVRCRRRLHGRLTWSERGGGRLIRAGTPRLLALRQQAVAV